MANSPSSQRLPAIDALRGVAVLAVVACHLPFSDGSGHSVGVGDGSVMAVLRELVGFGGYGVNLFFVISGFCIHMTWARAPEAPVRFLPFWRRRLHRLYPPYFVALVLSIAGLFVLNRLRGVSDGSFAGRFGYDSLRQFWVDLVALLTLSQNLNGASLRIGNGPFWSLAVEEQLYIMYFALLWMRRRAGWPKTLIAVASVTFTWRALPQFVPLPATWFVLGPARWLEWTLGAVAVEAYLGRVRLPAWCSSYLTAATLIVAGLVANSSFASGAAHMLHLSVISDAILGAGFFMWVNAACRTNWLGGAASVSSSLLLRAGIVSYSIYLTHVPLMAVAKVLAHSSNMSTTMVVILRFALAILGGYIFYLVVERRFLNSSRRHAGLRAYLPVQPAAPDAAVERRP